MAGGAAAPTVYGGGFVEYSLNGTDISPYVSEAELTEEDDVLEFKGSGGSATARIPNGVTNGFSLTVASNGTTAPLLRTLHRTVPKPTATTRATSSPSTSSSPSWATSANAPCDHGSPQ
jgi:hypothetical protein